jgi:hypothetical protein
MKVFARAVLPLSISLVFSLSAFAQNKRGCDTRGKGDRCQNRAPA